MGGFKERGERGETEATHQQKETQGIFHPAEKRMCELRTAANALCGSAVITLSIAEGARPPDSKKNIAQCLEV